MLRLADVGTDHTSKTQPIKQYLEDMMARREAPELKNGGKGGCSLASLIPRAPLFSLFPFAFTLIYESSSTSVYYSEHKLKE